MCPPCDAICVQTKIGKCHVIIKNTPQELREQDSVYRMDTTTFNSEKVIDFSSFTDGMTDDEHNAVMWCDDYVVIDLSYLTAEDDSGELLIYDYEGNFIRKE